MARWPYSTRRWQRLRKLKLASTPLCEYGPHDRVTPATQVDHRRAIEQGGDPWAWENLASTCAACHSAKTSTVEVHGGDHRHIKGVDVNGMPLCPCHPWHRR